MNALKTFLVLALIFWALGYVIMDAFIRPAYGNSELIDRGVSTHAYMYGTNHWGHQSWGLYNFGVEGKTYEGSFILGEARSLDNGRAYVGDSIKILYSNEDPSNSGIPSDTIGKLVHWCYKYRKLMGAVRK